MEKIAFDFNGKKLYVHLRDEADRSVFNEIFKLKEYRAAAEAVKNAQYPILDVGAHASFFSIYCFTLNEKARIFAFEPEPENFKFLEKNIKANGIKTIKTVRAALAGATGQRDLALAADSHNHRLLGAKEESDRQTIAVKCYSLPDFCRSRKIKKISLLKMDIEGGETEVLDGVSADDLRMVNFIILEYHNNEECGQMELKLRESGFTVRVFPSHFAKNMGFLFANNRRFI